MIRIIESFEASRADEPSLDRLVVTDDYVAVFDGATVKGVERQTGTTLSQNLMDRLAATIEVLPPDLTGPQIVDALTAAAAALPRVGEFRPSSAGVIFSSTRREVTSISDCWTAFDDERHFDAHDFETHLAAIRAAVIESELARGADVEQLRRDDPGRTVILPALEIEHTLRNVATPGEWFFAGIDGRPVPPHLLTIRPVPDGTGKITLASDGYPWLGTLAESERYLQEMLDDDPLLIGRHRGTKAVQPGAASFDDRTYVRFALDPPDTI